MPTAVKLVSIQHLVAELRKLSESAFDGTEQIRTLMKENPVEPETLAPYLTWDRQHYTRNLIDMEPAFQARRGFLS